MSKSRNNVEPQFSLVPNGNVHNQTLDYLENFFQKNPKATLSVTVTMTKEFVRDFKRGHRASLASFRGTPRRGRLDTDDE